MIYGERLKLLRFVYGLSLQDIADKTGLSKQKIDRFERNKLQLPTATLVGISRLFVLDDDFFTKKVIVVGFSEHTNKIINQWKQ